MPTSYSLGKARGNTMELTLPSLNEEGEHNVCKVRKPDPTLLISAGLLDDFDSLTALVATKIQDIEGKRRMDPEGLKELAGQKSKLLLGLEIMDRLLEVVVVAPRVVWPARRNEAGEVIRDADGLAEIIPEAERRDDTLYTDDVDLEDRMFILQFAVGGVKDFEQFRHEHQEFVGGMAAGGALPLSAI